MTVKKVLSLFMIIILGGLISLAAERDDLEVKATPTAQKLTVDGRLDEPAWQESEVISRLIQREPNEGEPATEPTEIRILYDDKFLYIGVLCFDSQSDKIVANEMRRDEQLRNDDFFEIFIDTYHDHRNAFYFSTNPLGAKRDGLIREEGSNINRDWDGLWYVKTQRSDRGWTAEFAIPFYALRFSGNRIQTWGINFGRQIARKKEECFWAPILRDYGFMGKFRVSFYGNLVGLTDVKQGKRLHIMPFVIGGAVQEEGESSMGFTGDAGLDIKYGLTSNLTADISINTDFAQVESDQEQFNLTRFSLYFPEKRTFFLEGAEVFRVAEKFRFHEPPGLFLFYSRRIGLSEEGGEVPVIGGARVTGKAGKYDLGILNMMTDRITLETDGVVEHMERSNYAVFRAKRDFLQKSTLGVMLLSRDSLDSPDYNRGVAFDYNLAFGHALRIEGFAAKTFSPDLKGKDWAAHLNFSFDTDFWSLLLVYLDVGENFNAEMGYVPRLDQRKYRANFGISPRPKIFNLRQTHIYNDFTYIENHTGQLETRTNSTGIWNTFQDRSNLYFGYRQNFEYLDEAFEIKEGVVIPVGIHRFNSFDGFYESDKSRPLSVRFEIGIGGFYNGDLLRINASGTMKISKHLNIELSLNRNRFDLPIEGGKFTANILATRIIYSFSPALYAKAFIQWNDDENLFKSNILIRWIYKPGANIYFIYNETQEFGIPNPLQDRGVMIKATFLFN
ncbi:MAG: carbohydrate binding family 9 domain-containing protein [Candidatus Aminicenantes bacterium]|nr:carbohydrate binding family 9 domain-containing protein [Candidatus Aminicenantes bacterium]